MITFTLTTQGLEKLLILYNLKLESTFNTNNDDKASGSFNFIKLFTVIIIFLFVCYLKKFNNSNKYVIWYFLVANNHSIDVL